MIYHLREHRRSSMLLNVSVFERFNQKVMYLPDVNYYFAIKDNSNIKLGEYKLCQEEIVTIVKENDLKEYEVFAVTSLEERLSKIATYNIQKIKETSSRGLFTLCLHPSRKCNLNCKYCFKDSQYLGEEQLSFAIAKDAIDFVVNEYAPCASKYVVDLSGSGEPLLEIKLLKQIVDYCKQKRDEICKNIEVMFCTNLTLLTPEIVEYLDNEPVIILGVSIDGDRVTNDGNRVYANGKGTYDDIVKGLKMFKNKKLGLAVTITPLNQNVDSIYDCLYRLPNVDCISMKFIRNYDGSKYDFGRFDMRYMLSRYKNLCNRIFEELSNDNFDYLQKLVRGGDYFGGIIYSNMFKGTYKIYRCDAGKSRISVNSEGDIFACSVMNGNQDFSIGNIYEGIESRKQKKFEFVSVESLSTCQSCLIRNACGGECYTNSYLKNNSLYTPVDGMCILKKELNKLSMSFIEVLKRKHMNMYDKFADFVVEVGGYEVTPSEVWALLLYLKTQKVNYKYIEVVKFFKDYSDPIEGILNYLRELDENTSIYKLTDTQGIKIPAIAICNKVNMSNVNFVVVVDVQGDNIVFKQYGKSIISTDVMTIYDFIKYISDIIIC